MRGPLGSFRPVLDPRRIEVRPFMLGALLIVLASKAFAQDHTVVVGEPPVSGPKGFGGRAVDRVSSTTVIHLQLEPAPAGGGALAFAVLIKGPEGWNRKNVAWGQAPAAPGFQGEYWTVGDSLKYILEYNREAKELRAFGETFNLTQTSLILVTLDSAAVSPRSIERGGRPQFVLAEPRGGIKSFMGAVSQAREFAESSYR